MSGRGVVKPCNSRRVMQPPSVPFLWEERPGIAKKDWRPEDSPVTVTPALPPPVKFIASVPFKWEERPGTPLRCFGQPPSVESTAVTPPAKLVALPLPPMFSHEQDRHKHDNANKDKHEGMFEMDVESFSFETDDSLSSTPSRLANCLVSLDTISTAVPVEGSSSANETNDGFESPSSPASESDSSTSSYATGVSSLAGGAFLECLFPLYPPNSGFLGRASYSKNDRLPPPELKTRGYDHETDSNIVASRPPTLGELIMMSRRRSCRRKAAQTRKQNLSMELMSKKAVGCCTFGTAIKRIGGLQRRQRPRLNYRSFLQL